MIRPGQSERTHIVNAFCMRLYLCWVPTVATAMIVATVSRRRARAWWLAVPLALGLLSAGLWGFNQLSHPAPWMCWMKWPKLLSTGLMALVFVIRTGLLARALAERFPGSRASTESLPHPEPPMTDDTVTRVQAR